MLIYYCLLVFFISMLVNLSRYFILSNHVLQLSQGPWRQSNKIRVSEHQATKEQLKNEAKWGVRSCIVFSLLTVGTFLMVYYDLTKFYLFNGLEDYYYVPASILMLIVMHDIYFYLMHRAMHANRWLMKNVHRVHHQFRHPSPYSDMCFHPIEAALQFMFFPIALLILPLNPVALAIYATVVTYANLLGHTGYELIPRNLYHSWPGKFFNATSAHAWHHIDPKRNFGLYSSIFDRLLNTHTDHPKMQNIPTQKNSPSREKVSA